MEVDRQLLDLIDLVYAAGADGAWQPFLQQFAARLSGEYPILYRQPIRCGPNDHATILATDIPRPAIEQYAEYYASRNVLLIHGTRLLGEGRVRTGEMMCSEATLLASEYYNDFLKPLDIRYSIGGTIATDGVDCCSISVFRGHKAAPFEEEDLALLGTLLPHLRRAMQLQSRLADLDERTHWHAESLDRLALGVICLGSRAEVRHANASARAILQSKNGLTVEGGLLRAASPAATAALHALVSSAAQTTRGQGTSAGEAVPLPRCGKRPLEALVVPARGCGSSSRCGTVALMFVSDPDRDPVSIESRARRFYNLTPAEARVVGGLMKGEALEEIAERSDTSVHTVRSQVKKVFEKTGTKRQADLLRLIGRWSSVVEAAEHGAAHDSNPARAVPVRGAPAVEHCAGAGRGGLDDHPDARRS